MKYREVNHTFPPLTICESITKQLYGYGPYDFDYSLPLEQLQTFVLPPLAKNTYLGVNLRHNSRSGNNSRSTSKYEKSLSTLLKLKQKQ